MILRVRQVTGGMLERELAHHYTFSQVVEHIDTALETDTPVKFTLHPGGHDFILTPDTTIAIALVES